MALHRGPAELAADLAEHDLPGCAALVREGLRAAAPAIREAVEASEMGGCEVFDAQIVAWAAGDDEAVARSNDAWRAASGCEACALRGLQPNPSRCDDCTEAGR